MQAVECPTYAFRYNGTQCSCNPGYVYNLSRNSCDLFAERGPEMELSSGVDYDSSLAFPETIFSFNSMKKFTQSQAVFLEATLLMLLFWLGFCLLLRLFPLGSDGRSPWFKIRWWISRLDISFATQLGGAFSIASWILFIGLFAALLYQIISKRSVEVHNVRATNAPDLASFLNDLEFNITTISSMSCAHLRGLGTLVTGNLAFIDNRVVPLSTFANYSCLNTTMGPTITLHCSNCRLIPDFAHVSWQFVDLPNNPATAVGFQFNLSAKNHADKKHLSFVSGTLKNGSNFDDKPITYRGTVIYHNLHDLKLIQPLFHEFLPGSYFGEVNGLINTTLSINFLSSYIVEIDNQNVLGPVSFLADLGGLYCISIGIFFYFLVQCEYRIKRLRNEDSTMRKIRNRRKAQERWEKLRKYVRYTWGSSLLDDIYGREIHEACCAGVMLKPLHQRGSSLKQRLPNRMDAVSFSKKLNLPNEKKAEPEHIHTQEVRSHLTEPALNLEKRPSFPNDKPEDLFHGNVERRKDEPSPCSHLGGCCHNRGSPTTDIANIPPVPPFEFSDCNEISMIDLQKNLQKLYEYNILLREKLIAAQSMAHV
ncbi:hypothetical protein Pfo_029169 [Paulownia fortunei]|nr:hypothetical protein Pfo_029169 [Paulownia fortunei]